MLSYVRSSFVTRKPTSNTVPGRCGTLLRWSEAWPSMRLSGSWVSFWRKARFRCVTQFWKLKRWLLNIKTLSSRRICGLVSLNQMFHNSFQIDSYDNVFPSKAESFCTKGKVFKGVRRHARARVGKVEYFHTHYFVRLEEGIPPADYYGRQTSPEKQLDDWMEGMRKRKIIGTL